MVEPPPFATGADNMSFDLLAPHYRWMEAVLAGDKLQRCRTHWLDQVRHCRSALLVGEGNGRFLAACAENLPQAHFTVIDASQKMLRQAEARWKRAGGESSRVQFLQAALPESKLPERTFDLIVTNCFFDCFASDPLAQVIANIAARASDDAVWLVTDFAVPQNGWAKWRAKAVLRLAYTFFRITTGIQANAICPPDPFLNQAGFAMNGRIEQDAGLLYSAMWQRTKNPNPATRTAARRHGSTSSKHVLPTTNAALPK
jgi:ubiquinone/menaquinone biosynthesis C-methylase UbiE